MFGEPNVSYVVYDKTMEQEIGTFINREELFKYLRRMGEEYIDEHIIKYRYKSHPVDSDEWETHEEFLKNLQGLELLKWLWPEKYCETPNLTIESDDFICTCSPDGDYRAKAIIAEAKRTLSNNIRTVDDSNLLDAICWGLNWNLKSDERIFAHIDSIGPSDKTTTIHIGPIYVDQWALVTAEAREWDSTAKTAKAVFHTSIQCDEIEAGVAATWLAMKQHFEVTNEEIEAVTD